MLKPYLRRWLMVVLLIGAVPVLAQLAPATDEDDDTNAPTIKSYRVLLEAPAEVRSYLNDYLDIFRAEKREKISEAEFYLLVDRVPENVNTLLRTLGYFEAQATTHLNQDEDGDWTVSVTVTPGTPVKVRSVDIQLNGAIRDNPEALQRFERLQRWLWQLPVGARFEQSLWVASKDRLLSFLTARTWATARLLKSEAKINIAEHAADLSVALDSGPPYVFGPVSISGFARYPQSIAENRLNVKEGEPYSQNLLRNLQTDLQTLPYFNGVVVEGTPTTSAPWTVPVTLQVEEGPRNKLDLSLGYSTNKGPHLLGQYAFYNLFNRGLIFDTILNLSRDSKTGEVGITFPRSVSGYDHRLYASYGNDDTQGWKSKTKKIGVTRAKSEDGIDRIYTLEYIRENRHDDWGVRDQLDATAVGVRWTQNTTVPRNSPRRGYQIQGEAQLAVKGLLTDESFVRLYGRGTYFLPVFTRSVAFARIEAGQTFSEHPDKVPTQYLFRAGGSGSVRGYDYQSMGILNHSSVIPGRVLATASLEYQQSIIDNWRAALFVDYGDAADRWTDWDGQTGVGVGARWQSPVGTLGTDLAYGIDDKKWRFYFSLGMAF